MKVVDRVRALALSIAGALVLPIACDAGGIVGGSCRAGTTVCGDVCIDLRRDPENCGECDTRCGADEVCRDGRCATPSEGGTDAGGSGGTGGSGTSEGGTGDPAGAGGAGAQGGDDPAGGRAGGNAGGRGGRGGNGGNGNSTNGGGEAVCLPPFDVPEQCGDCDTVCNEPTPLCAPNEVGGFECVPSCPPPLQACGDQCVDTNLHPLHCGECFHVCASGICQAGMCVGATTGHVALFCMNYAAVNTETSHAVMLGNAVFLPLRSEVRILAFTRWAPGSVRAQADAAIRASAARRGRSGVFTNVTTAAEVNAALNVQDFDVFLVYEQSQAPAGELATVGTLLRNSMVLDAFARAGGVVVVLNGAQGRGEMAEFIDSAGLLELDGQRAIALEDTTTRFFNRAPGDALGINVVSPMSPLPFSCVFEPSAPPSTDTVFVVTDAESPATGAPVVVHRIFFP